MPLRFNCEHCKSGMDIKFLNKGEKAECKKCGKKTIVPQYAKGSTDALTPKREANISNVADDRNKDESSFAFVETNTPQPRCSKCKALVKINDQFCWKCGVSFEGLSDNDEPNNQNDNIVCSSCNTSQNANAVFCDQCGSKLQTNEMITIYYCEKCNSEYDLDSKYCSKDGIELIKKEVEIDTIEVSSEISKSKPISSISCPHCDKAFFSKVKECECGYKFEGYKQSISSASKSTQNTPPVQYDSNKTRYNIYQSPSGEIQAVKVGWSWPGFFFNWVWCFVKNLFGHGFGILGALFLLGIISVTSASMEVLTSISGLGITIWLGSSGNRFREDNLKSRGFDFKKSTFATNPEGAVASFIKESQS
jgi:hypothetical protein